MVISICRLELSCTFFSSFLFESCLAFKIGGGKKNSINGIKMQPEGCNLFCHGRASIDIIPTSSIVSLGGRCAAEVNFVKGVKVASWRLPKHFPPQIQSISINVFTGELATVILDGCLSDLQYYSLALNPLSPEWRETRVRSRRFRPCVIVRVALGACFGRDPGCSNSPQRTHRGESSTAL